MAWEPKKPRVAVCCPYAGRSLPSEFVFQTLLPLYAPVPFCDKLPFFSASYGVAHARNTLVQIALQQNVDYILWVDSDMVVDSVGVKEVEKDGKKVIDPETNEPKLEPNKTTDPNIALAALLQIDAPFVSGLYRAKQAEGFFYAAWDKIPAKDNRNFTPIEKWTGNWIKVDVVGLGFTLTKAEIYKKITPPWFHWDMPDEMSEDFYFCERVKEAGYEVKVFTDVRLRHLGEFGLDPDGSINTRRV